MDGVEGGVLSWRKGQEEGRCECEGVVGEGLARWWRVLTSKHDLGVLAGSRFDKVIYLLTVFDGR